MRLTLLLFASYAAAQPVFDAARVLRNGATEPEPLVSGKWYSIYGKGLARDGECAQPAGSSRERCGVQILIDGNAVQLNFVSSSQINFLTEALATGEGTVELSHLLGGQTTTIRVPRGPLPVKLGVQAQGRAGMPVWLDVKIPNRTVQFPVKMGPQRWGCHFVEVWRDGELLPRRPLAEDVVIGNGIGPCGVLGLSGVPTKTNRLPLHLLYRFDQAGVYTVRYTLRADERTAVVIVESVRMNFRLDAADSEFRRQWLDSLMAGAAVELVTDYLPTIGGYSDQRTRELLGRFVDHENQLVRYMARSLVAMQ